MTWEIAGEPARQATYQGENLRFGLWDLPPETDVTWSIEWTEEGKRTQSATGVVTTGQVPEAIDIVLEDRGTPSPTAIERLMFPVACPVRTDDGSLMRPPATLVITDGEGVVRWYEVPPARGTIRAFDVGLDDSAWMMIDRRNVYQVRFDGTPLTELGQPSGFPHHGHHDITSRFGQTVLLHARTETINGTDYIVDGLTALDEGEAEVVFTVSDALVPRLTGSELGGYWGFGGNRQIKGIDFGHANSIDIDADGRWLISFKHLDAVMAFDGGPDSPTRGALLFSLVGGARGLDGGDYALVEADGQTAGGFEFPHHARWLGEHRISLFDNGRPPAQGEAANRSRAITVDLDDERRIATIDQSFEINSFCPIQSSAYTLSDGSMLLLCQSTARMYVFAPDETPLRETQVDCSEGRNIALFPRIVPLDRDYRPIP
ncbi:MAG: aryl-sulfate sulfotransferase [Myxococcota bacterium]